MEPLGQFLSIHRATIDRLYARSGAARWHVGNDEFAATLHQSCEHRFADEPGSPSQSAVESFLESLHVEDLALAIGCRAGNEQAWQHLQESHGPIVQRFARALVRDPVRAREIADSLWADLYGLSCSADALSSPLAHYHGRSALSSWLRVVIARREADAWRKQRREQPINEMTAQRAAADANTGGAEPGDPERPRYLALVSEALTCALAAMSPRDRLRLSYYYVQGLTLAETAALIGEHESTASRNLARTRLAIRRLVERRLRREHRLSDDQIGQCFEYATEDWTFDLKQALAQGK